MRLNGRAAAAMAAFVTAAAGALAAAMPATANATSSFIGPLNNTAMLTSTVPANGDVNPYGMAVVPRSTGFLHEGNVLISNFNNAANVQGTGTTIVQITPSGHLSLFAQINPNLPGCPGGVGLTTALVALRSGFVIVGSLPTQNGNISGAGCLIVLDRFGHVRETFTGNGINGPWDMTALDQGATADLFVTNVLNGTVNGGGSTVNGGTVLRLFITTGTLGLPRLLHVTQIGSGFGEKTDQNALVIGPTGVGLGPNGTLYVADTLANRIAAIPGAVFRHSDDGTGKTVSQGDALNGELGLTVAPNGDILTVNGGDGNMVEVTPGGAQVAVKTVTAGGGGALFGLVVKPHADAVYYVDDSNNTFNLLF